MLEVLEPRRLLSASGSSAATSSGNAGVEVGEQLARYPAAAAKAKRFASAAKNDVAGGKLTITYTPGQTDASPNVTDQVVSLPLQSPANVSIRVQHPKVNDAPLPSKESVLSLNTQTITPLKVFKIEAPVVRANAVRSNTSGDVWSARQNEVLDSSAPPDDGRRTLESATISVSRGLVADKPSKGFVGTTTLGLLTSARRPLTTFASADTTAVNVERHADIQQSLRADRADKTPVTTSVGVKGRSASSSAFQRFALWSLHATYAPLIFFKRRASWIALAAVAVLCLEIILLATRQGIAVTGDSVTYISAARSIVNGNGVYFLAPDSTWRAMTQFPPVYPFALAMGSIPFGNTFTSAHAINIMLLVCTVLIVGRLNYRLTRSHWYTLAAAVLVGLSGHTLGVYATAYSEPLFNVLNLLTFVLLARRALGHKSCFLVAIIGLTASIAFLTRYAGALTVAIGFISVLFLSNNRLTTLRRLRDIGVYVLAASVLPALWLYRNHSLTEAATSRSLGFHPPATSELSDIFNAVGNWGLEWTPITRAISSFTLLVILIALPVRMIIRRKHVQSRRWQALLPIWMFAAFYVPFIVVSHTFFDAAIPFNYRLLSPMLAPLVIFSVVFLQWSCRVMSVTHSRMGRPAITCISCLLAFVSINRVYGAEAFTKTYEARSRGYASASWKNSPLIDYVRQLPPNTTLFTNGPDAIYILTGRIGRNVPVAWRPISDTPNRALPRDVAQLRQALAVDKDAKVIYFDQLKRDGMLIAEADLVFRLGLERIETFPDGRVYRLARRGKLKKPGNQGITGVSPAASSEKK